jgi:hypothetical protein
MMKFLIGLLGAGVLATGGYAAATNTHADPPRTVSVPGATTNHDVTTAATTASAPAATAEDVSGPCDEAEHANDPRCTGASASMPAPAPAQAPATTTDDANEDVSGPCDEAEHASDPRCTGGAAAEDDDHGDGSGRGGHEDGDDDRSGHDGGGDDRSGSNSGKG